ncbi:MAG: LytR/AlgR family response regulator transcription factor [Bacteroidota bacterium]
MEKNIKLNAFVVDDEPRSCELLAHFLSEHPAIEEVKKSGRAKDAIPGIISFKPDVVFLDVEMPGDSGISIAEEISRLNLDTHIIFSTGHAKYAIPALRLAATDFLLKPVDKRELDQAINKVLALKAKSITEENQHSNTDEPWRIRFTSRNGFIMLNPHDLLYVQADMNYSELFLKNGHKEVVSVNLGAVEKLLPPGEFFASAGRWLSIFRCCSR